MTENYVLTSKNDVMTTNHNVITNNDIKTDDDSGSYSLQNLFTTDL